MVFQDICSVLQLSKWKVTHTDISVTIKTEMTITKNQMKDLNKIEWCMTSETQHKKKQTKIGFERGLTSIE